LSGHATARAYKKNPNFYYSSSTENYFLTQTLYIAAYGRQLAANHSCVEAMMSPQIMLKKALSRRFVQLLKLTRGAKVIPKSELSDFVVAQHIKYIFQDRKIDFVIDAGAHIGRFGSLIPR
jgi:hypothetical protein